MKVENKTKSTPEKVKEKEISEDLEHLNKKRKLQNKVLQKMVENLNNQEKKNSGKKQKTGHTDSFTHGEEDEDLHIINMAERTVRIVDNITGNKTVIEMEFILLI
jgi:hypothetical protein